MGIDSLLTFSIQRICIHVITMILEEEMTDVTIGELKPQMKHFNLIFKVLEIGEIREVVSRYDKSTHNVSDVIVGDHTGTIIIPVWDEMIDRFKVGKHYKVTNGFTNLYQKHLRLSIGRFGFLQEIDEHFDTILLSNNMSHDTHEMAT